MLGATMIESDWRGPDERAHAVDLLNAAFALHPAFAEAEIIEMGADLRPAFPDNIPAVKRIGRCSISTGCIATAICWRPRWPKASKQRAVGDETRALP